MRVVYHATFASRVRKIRREGLRLGRRRNWSNMFGGRMGDTKKVYFFTNFDSAMRWAHKIEWVHERPAVVLTVELLDGSRLFPDARGDPSYVGGVTYASPVPPECVKSATPYTPEYARALAGFGAVLPPVRSEEIGVV